MNQRFSLYKPPSPPPLKREQLDIQFNLNEVLREEQRWKNKNLIISMSQPIAALLAVHIRLFQNHRNGAIYDVKSSNGVWVGNAEYGNFLYGAIMQVHGFPESMALRYSSAYQAWQSRKAEQIFTPILQGFANFITNTGDNEGDHDEVSQGYRYAAEVFHQNTNSLLSSSCIDKKTINKAVSGGGGTYPGIPNSNENFRWQSICELWQFPDGNNNFYYMYRNCTYYFTLIP